MVSFRTWQILPATLAFLLMASPRNAEACSPLPPGIQSTIPANDGTHPANATVLISGVDLDVSKIVAKVDGAPAVVKPASTLAISSNSFGAGAQAITFEPALKAGQKVELSGSICSFDGGTDCTLALSFTVGESDTVAPGAIEKVSLDIYDYNDFKSSGGDCQSNSDMAIFASIQAKEDKADPGYWLVDGYDAKTGKNLLFSGVYIRDDSKSNYPIRLLKNALQGNEVPSGICIEVTGFDLAGNKTEAVRQCDPCRFRQDPAPGTPENFPPTEPAWTDADIVPGGACDPGGAGAGGSGGSGQAGSGGSSAGGSSSSGIEAAPDGGDDGGCSVSVGRGGPGLAGALAALAALGVLVRRRRSA